MSLSLTVNPVNSVCPLPWYLVTVTCLVGIDPTFIAGILFTHTSCLGCVNSSQTPAFSQGTQAALLLGSPGRERDTLERSAEVFGLQPCPYNNEWANCSSHECRYGTDGTVFFFVSMNLIRRKYWDWNVNNLPVKSLRTIQCFQRKVNLRVTDLANKDLIITKYKH